MQIKYKELSKQLNNEPNQPFYIPTQATTTRLGQQFRTKISEIPPFELIANRFARIDGRSVHAGGGGGEGEIFKHICKLSL